MSRVRAWVWTLNNFTAEDVVKISELGVGDGADISYLCYGKEVGESGTPHLQGYVYTRNPVGLSWVRKRIPRAHFEVSRGRPDQAIAYCEKDGDFNERGVRPKSSIEKGEGEKRRWEETRENAKKGDFDSVPADIFVKYYRTLKEIAKDHMVKPPDHDGVTGVWIWGESGVGKSRLARERYPDAYMKMANKWWDGYQGEESVILDDLDKGHSVLGHHLKIWADRYAFIGENKGGAVSIRPKKFIVTSQYSIDQIWEDEETRDALKRRFEVIDL